MADPHLPRFAAELVRRWLWAAGITNGPIFRSVDRTSKVGKTLHPTMVGRIIAKMAKRADIVADLTGHSLRVGMAQDLTTAGFELSGIMQAGRWKSPEMTKLQCECVDAVAQISSALPHRLCYPLQA